MDGNVKAIPLQGIVHNETKIGVQDGMCEDLVNLRFKDGSWRPSGEGKMVLSSFGAEYSDLYIHTNVYRHLLGTKINGGSSVLCWIGDISDAGVVTMKETAVAITSVTGEVNITQSGHLIAIIDEADDIEYFAYRTDEHQYVAATLEINGKQSARSLHPFGQVHFNLYEPPKDLSDCKEHLPVDDIIKYETDNMLLLEPIDVNLQDLGDDFIDYLKSLGYISEKTAEEQFYDFYPKRVLSYLNVLQKLSDEKNMFTRPFMAVCALKMYDGSYVYASQPTLLTPRAVPTYDRERFTLHYTDEALALLTPEQIAELQLDENNRKMYSIEDGESFFFLPYVKYNLSGIDVNQNDLLPGVERSILGYHMTDIVPAFSNGFIYETYYHDFYQAAGSDIVVTIGDELKRINSSVFTHVAIFVTRQADIYDFSEKGHIRKRLDDGSQSQQLLEGNMSYEPVMRDTKDIISDLVHSPFYLLKEVTVESFNDSNTIHIKASEIDKGVLANIVQQRTLSFEAFNRMEYCPRVAYNYNGRLHIADYTAKYFHGYPLDFFQKNGHSVAYDKSGNYLGLSGVVNNDDTYQQWSRSCAPYEGNSAMSNAAAPMAFAVVELETDKGVRKVARYIPANTSKGREKLDCMLSYPDYRAKSITIYWYDATPPASAGAYTFRRKTFDLTPHPYLNLAYYVNNDMKPIDWESMTSLTGVASVDAMFGLVQETNITEEFPNSLKVSSTLDPMFFPVENTYQVGSAQILALCSNTLAVGTGQTGEAPLYVFCKDGIYALFVDASGQMAYPNARAIARDVLNNAKSVTPIDAGVVFTTERGLMMIAGEQVQEIGQPLEGDILQYHVKPTPSYDNPDYNNICAHAYRDSRNPKRTERLADLRDNSNAALSFLEYLDGSIINYNHNEWELMVSNPYYNYTYIMDKYGNWSRRDYGAAMYVNNYPTSYRVWRGKMYQVDKENDLENEEERDAGNGTFFMTREIKLDSIGFKSLQRVVVRGFFSTLEPKMPEPETDDSTEPEEEPVETNEQDVVEPIESEETQAQEETVTKPVEIYYLGLYVFGSHDSRKWACLGYRERTGPFTDIGCLVERTDCKFFRIVLAGQLKKESRLDYIEVSAKQSKLSTKIR